jgi:hypothetical protein
MRLAKCIVGQSNSEPTSTICIKRTIYELETNDHGEIYGTAMIQSRPCYVKHNPRAWLKARRIDSQATWEVVEVI